MSRGSETYIGAVRVPWYVNRVPACIRHRSRYCRVTAAWRLLRGYSLVYGVTIWGSIGVPEGRKVALDQLVMRGVAPDDLPMPPFWGNV